MRGPGPLSVLEPFKLTLWLTLLCTVVGVAIVFWLLDMYSKWIRTRQTRALRRTGVLTGRAAARAKQDEDSHVFISFMAAAGAPERPRRSSWGVQVLYLAYCFFCLIVLSSYTANLTSFLAVRRAAVGIQGLQDLVRDNALLGVNPNGSTAAYFASSQDTLATQLQPRVRYCATDTCVAWLRSGEVAAFVSDQPLLDYIAEQQPCDLSVVGDPFGPGNLVVGLQKGSPWLQLFNTAIQKFSEDGTLTTLYRTWFDGLSQCDDGTAAILESSRLGVDQMLGAFVFLLFGALAAFIISNCENLKWCLVRAYSAPNATSRTSSSGALRNSWHRISSNLLGVNELLEEAGVAPWPNPAQQQQQGAEQLGAEQQQQPEGWGQPYPGKGGAFDPNAPAHPQTDASTGAAQQLRPPPVGQQVPQEGLSQGPGPGMWPRVTASGRVLPGAPAALLVGLVSRKSGFTHSPRLREHSDFGADVEDAAEVQQEAATGQAAVAAAAAALVAGGSGGGGFDEGSRPGGQAAAGSHVAPGGPRHRSVELQRVAAARHSAGAAKDQSSSSRDGCSSEGEPYHRASSYLLQPSGTVDSCTLLLPRGARSSDGRAVFAGAGSGAMSVPSALAGTGLPPADALAAAQFGGGSSWRRNPIAVTRVAAHAHARTHAHAHSRGDACGAGIDEDEDGVLSSRGSSCSGAFVSGSALEATATSGPQSSGEVWGSAAADQRGSGSRMGGSSSHMSTGAYRPPSLVQTMAHVPAARPGSPLGPGLAGRAPPPPIQLHLQAVQQQQQRRAAPQPQQQQQHQHQPALGAHLRAPSPQPLHQQRAAAGRAGGGGGGGGGGGSGSPQLPPAPQQVTRLAASVPYLPLVAPPPENALAEGAQQLPLPPSRPPRPPGSAAATLTGLGASAAGGRAAAAATGITPAAAESPLAPVSPAWALTSGGGTSNPDTAMASFVTAPDATTLSTMNYSGPMVNLAIATLNAPAAAGPAAGEHAAHGAPAVPAAAAAAVGAASQRLADDDEEDSQGRGGESVMSFLYQPPLAPSRW
ncbi:hypothetical protein HXX76_008132 [Chlamydomonas incerta]|uniref:Ionotropic glutamate receptor C-terminal domain-containing protein n=1 Tax=Chlamydomonas incerta TaxID=51695 RepID=A0A835SXW2_CHLIN|nr:hypothetical protein HXX76_008132 [Chlamydomonas incerta]|eukprot:KAG2433771.1 hypothetical protein HXX76_008132 [Chlamydomonas incerta]